MFSTKVIWFGIRNLSLSFKYSKMADEVAKARAASPKKDTVFGKILRKEISAVILHEDEKVFLLMLRIISQRRRLKKKNRSTTKDVQSLH